MHWEVILSCIFVSLNFHALVRHINNDSHITVITNRVYIYIPPLYAPSAAMALILHLGKLIPMYLTEF